MKGSQELIAYFNKREEELGEKATKFNMFLEGYAEGYNDTKAEMINKACDEFCNRCPCYADDLNGLQGCGKLGCDVLKDFRKAMEDEK